MTGSIEEKLADGDVPVVWLLDAPRSLVDDRQRVADRLQSFFRHMDNRGGKNDSHRFVSAVAAFGVKVTERVAPTEYGDRIVNSIKQMPVDASGNENVFAAIENCVTRYQRKWRSQLMIVGSPTIVHTSETLQVNTLPQQNSCPTLNRTRVLTASATEANQPQTGHEKHCD